MNDRHEILNEYLLGELTGPEREELEKQIASDPQLAAEAAELAPIVARLEALPEEAWASDPPPFALPGAVQQQEQDRPAQSEGFWSRVFGGSLSVRPAIAFAACTLLFVGGVGVGLVSGGSSDETRGPSVQQAQLTPVRSIDAAAAGQADLKREGQSIRIKLTGLAPNSDDDFYEAWLLNDDGGLVALGTFRVGDDRETVLDLPVPVGTDNYPLVDISLQPINGKPTHSGVSVLRGKLES